MVEPSSRYRPWPSISDEQRVAARHQQHHERQLEVGLLEERGVEVRLEVVDGDERHVPHQRQRLGRADTPTSSAPTRPGPTVAADGVDSASSTVDSPASTKRLGDDRDEQLDVGPAGDLGHDAAEAGVEVDLAAHDRRQHRRARRRRPPRPSRRTRSRCRGSRARGRRPARSCGRAPRATVRARARRPRGAASRSAYVGLSTSWAHMTRASSLGLGVVALADPGRGEAEAPVERLAGVVARPHLEGQVLGAPLDGRGGERVAAAGCRRRCRCHAGSTARVVTWPSSATSISPP